MAFDSKKPIIVTLGGDIRFLWPYVFEKRPNEEGEDKYEVLVQIPYKNKKAIAQIKEAIDEAIDRGFSGELSDKSTFKKGTKEKALKLPLKDGADKEDEEYAELFEGYMYMTAKTQRRPTILDENGQQILDPEEFYSGVTGAVNVTVFPYNNRAQGVAVQLNHIMKLSDGERIGGGSGVSAEDAFAEYMGGTPARKASKSRSRDGEDDAPRRKTSKSRRRDEVEDSDDPMFD